jgi:hypothetical protein
MLSFIESHGLTPSEHGEKSILSKNGPRNCHFLFFANLFWKFWFNHRIEPKKLSLYNNFQIYNPGTHCVGTYANLGKMGFSYKIMLSTKLKQSVTDPNFLERKWSLHCSGSNAIYQISEKHSVLFICSSQGVGGLQKPYIGTRFSQKLHVRFSWNFFSE